MKRLLLAVAATGLGAGIAMADPVLGTWRTEADDGAYAHVKMQPCGDKVCGVIARTFNAQGEYKSPNLGKMLVRNMEPQGDGQYEGRVWRPSNDKIYLGKIDLEGNSLRLRGCVAGGLFCAKQTWTRVQ